MKPTHGRFVWFDVQSTTPEKTEEFLMGLFGWTLDAQHVAPPRSSYRLLQCNGRGIGGIVPFQEAEGVPSHWLPYVAVDSCAKTCEEALAHGGKVRVPPTELPGTGIFALLTDPGGGAVSVIELDAAASTGDPPHPAPVGAPMWIELHASDPARATSFYAALFGWTWREQELNPTGTYHFARVGDVEIAGCMELTVEAQWPQIWMHYMHVEDVDASHAKAIALGASVHIPPSDIPDVGRFTVLSGPSGAAFALIRPR